jgi:hypothetical protein
METAYDAPGVGQRVVVLHEVDIGNDLPEKAAIVRLAEEAACIAHNPRSDEPRVGYCERSIFICVACRAPMELSRCFLDVLTEKLKIYLLTKYI